MLEQRLNTIVGAIRRKREALQYSQEYMAAKMKMGQNCYSKIELGHSKLTVDRLIAICDLLDMRAGDLIDNSLHETHLFTIYQN